MSQLFISAAHKSSGKTTVTLGLCAALRARALNVQAFKKGPDYIDPLWLTRATGNPCHNLDFYTESRAEVLHSFKCLSSGKDIAIIEGNKGLYDGMDVEGTNSNAALAKLLHSPVVLVLDTQGVIRGVAPLLLGYQNFDSEVRIAGVILNRVGGHRHEKKLREVIARYTDLPVFGVIPRDPKLEIKERHLGLTPSNEDDGADKKIHYIAKLIAEQVDLDTLLAVAQTAVIPACPPHALEATRVTTPDVTIGVIRDESFGFYYPGDLAAIEQSGARLVVIDSLRDKHLPTVDGLFIGGGFPETQMIALEANSCLRTEIRQQIEHGLPVYAECGGLMYLARSITWLDRRCEMVGAIDGDVVMHERPRGRGYVCLQETGYGQWPPLEDKAADNIHAHEFHYSEIENLSPEYRFAYRVLRGTGVDGLHDGIIYKNLLACYTHLRDTDQFQWTERFVAFVRQCKNKL